MSKYIDADKLIAEIDDRLHCNGAFDEVGDYWWHYDQGMVDAYNHIKDFITSLQQEQPDADLEKEIKAEWDVIDTDLLRFEEFKDVCYRCYELGLNARKEK